MMYKKNLINKWMLQGIIATVFCVFALINCKKDEAPSPTVTSVTVSAAETSVGKGATLQFSATVVGEGNPAQTVKWSLTGNHRQATSISDAGLLTVAANESQDSLVIRATSTVDNSTYGELKIAVEADAPTVASVTVSATETSVDKGATLQFSATVVGEGNPAQTVIWSITGDYITSTSISDAGLLTVAADESQDSLVIRATSTVDNSKYGELKIAVITILTPVLLNKTDWLITHVSSTNTGENASVVGLLDGNSTTAWISSFGQSYNTSNPLYVEFDMLSEKQVNTVKVTKHANTKELEVKTSMNGTDWTSAGTIGENADQLVLQQPVRARHIRLYVTSSADSDGRGGIYEVDVEGAEIESSTYPAIFRYDRNDWEVLSAQSDYENRWKENLIDGDPNTFWVPRYSPVREQPPYWAVIDIVESKEITKILFYRRPRNFDTKTIQFYVGTGSDPNASSWTYLGEYTFPKRDETYDSGEVVVIDVSESTNTQGRYLKLHLPNSWNESAPSTGCAEVYLYGKVR
jgi:hypothetical protein